MRRTILSWTPAASSRTPTYGYWPDTLRLRQQGDRLFTHDANGNLETEPGRQFSYTPHNMLEGVSGTGASAYAYDADQWRVRKTAGSDTTIYVRGPHHELLTEWTNPGTTPRTFRDYIYAGTRLIAMVQQP